MKTIIIELSKLIIAVASAALVRLVEKRKLRKSGKLKDKEENG